MGVAPPQILDPIFNDHVSYKGSLSVEPSRRCFGERKKERKKKKETSAVKYNTSGHYVGGGIKTLKTVLQKIF